ncbi:DUF1330 domain-containing protein [Micromonospora sp. DT31]|uniref:DUF1330 domain-containing protein n=1 Tax=Micromonospora sp. DT31 TaxID=3393434 RepID=UPI003CEFD271
MTVYALAQLTIHDPERYGRYVAAFLPVLARHGGRLLAADTAARVVEGEWPYDKAILLSFDSREDFERWSTSSEYREISRDREAATEGVVVLLDGIGHAWPA